MWYLAPSRYIISATCLSHFYQHLEKGQLKHGAEQPVSYFNEGHLPFITACISLKQQHAFVPSVSEGAGLQPSRGAVIRVITIYDISLRNLVVELMSFII